MIHTYKKLIDKNDDEILLSLVENSRLNENHISSILNKKNFDPENYEILERIISIHSLSQQNISDIIGSNQKKLIGAVAYNQALNYENRMKILDLKDDGLSNNLFRGNRDEYTDNEYLHAIDLGVSLDALYMAHASNFKDKHYAAALEKNEHLNYLFWSNPKNISENTKKLAMDKIFFRKAN